MQILYGWHFEVSTQEIWKWLPLKKNANPTKIALLLNTIWAQCQINLYENFGLSKDGSFEWNLMMTYKLKSNEDFTIHEGTIFLMIEMFHKWVHYWLHWILIELFCDCLFSLLFPHFYCLDNICRLGVGHKRNFPFLWEISLLYHPSLLWNWSPQNICIFL